MVDIPIIQNNIPVKEKVVPESTSEVPVSESYSPPPSQSSQNNNLTPLIFGVLAALIAFVVLVFVKNLSSNKPKEVSLKMWGFWDKAAIESLAAEYKKQNPEVSIEYINQSKQDYRERLSNSLSKAGAPDIFLIHNSWTPMFTKNLSALPKEVITQAEFTKTFYPVAASDLTIGNSIIGIPLEYDALTLFINEDIFSSSGKTPPKTWDDLRKLAKDPSILKKDSQGTITQAGVALGRTENVDYWPEILGLMMLQSGANLNAPSGEEVARSLRFFSLLSTVDGAWDATLPESTLAFSTGKLAMYFAPSSEAFNIISKNPGLKFKTVELPQLARGGSTETAVSYATYWSSSVWNKSANSEAAWKFLNFLSSRESQVVLNAASSTSLARPHSRMDMADLQKSDQLLGSVVSLASVAQSWYLYSATSDGTDGINTQMNSIYEEALNATIKGGSGQDILEKLSSAVVSVLANYGVLN